MRVDYTNIVSDDIPRDLSKESGTLVTDNLNQMNTGTNSEEQNTSLKNSNTTDFIADDEETTDPISFIDGFIKIYEHMAKDENYKQSMISIAEYAEKVQSVLLGIKAGLEKCEYYIKPFNLDCDELDIGSYKLKKTLIENMYIVQPIERLRITELVEISKALQKQSQEGAFNKKAIMVLPYDVRVLKATLKE